MRRIILLPEKTAPLWGQKALNNTSLSYANAHRPWQMFQDLFHQTLDVCEMAGTAKHKFRLKNKLLSLDSSTISLCQSLFPWDKFRRTKGVVKLHLLLGHDGYLPTQAYISTLKNMTSFSPARGPCRPVRLWPWTEATMIMPCLRIGPKTKSILSPVSRTMPPAASCESCQCRRIATSYPTS